MEIRPYEPLPESVEYGGKVYKLDLSYAAFFAAVDATEDDRLTDQAKLATALDLLVSDKHPLDPRLLQAVMDLLQEDRPIQQDGPKLMDVRQDWPYICAAFQQAYGIDLYENKSLHILRFRALLQAIPKDTKLSEIIGIRAAPIPAPNKHNQQQIAELTRLKSIYALRGTETNFQEGLAKLFDMLSARAK
jgi:hypothetical protein